MILSLIVITIRCYINLVLPVQARELTTMQSILQDQIESMGNHFFKEGAKVIPGGTTFEDQFIGIQIDPEFLGVPVSLVFGVS